MQAIHAETRHARHGLVDSGEGQRADPRHPDADTRSPHAPRCCATAHHRRPPGRSFSARKSSAETLLGEYFIILCLEVANPQSIFKLIQLSAFSSGIRKKSEISDFGGSALAVPGPRPSLWITLVSRWARNRTPRHYLLELSEPPVIQVYRTSIQSVLAAL